MQYYFKIYAILALTYNFFSFIRIIILYISSLRCSKTLHNQMMAKVIRAPLNYFFDRIPSGRILNRFSLDIDIIDQNLAGTLSASLVNVFTFVTDVIICIVFGSYFVIPLAVVFFYVALNYQKKYMTVNREIYRLCKWCMD